MKKFLLFIVVMICLGSCHEPIELDYDIECLPSNFVGVWKHPSSDVAEIDTILDLVIELSDDISLGDIMINGLYQKVNAIAGCTAGDISGFLDETYELKSKNELIKRFHLFVVLGSERVYTRQE